MTPKHAYLIIAHHEPQVLDTLLAALDDVRNDIFLHVDRRSAALRARMEEYRPVRAGFCLLPAPLELYWGDLSLVEAEFLLLEAAVAKGTYAYYHLLSGVDLPLKSQDYIHDFFRRHAGCEFVGFWQSAAHRRELDKRVSRYFFFTKALRPKGTLRHALATPLCNLLLIGQKLLGIRRRKEMEFRKGPQWFSVTHAFCLYLLSRKAFVLKRFAHTLCPDELFVQARDRNVELVVDAPEGIEAFIDPKKMARALSNIIRNGIFLTGGVANLKGLDGLIADATNIKVNLVDKPEECVARGLERVIKEKQFRSLTFVTKEQDYK